MPAVPVEPITLAQHKPRGVVTTHRDERGRSTVLDLLPAGLPYVFPVGRLDADSEGLLILTNDAALAAFQARQEQNTRAAAQPRSRKRRRALADAPARPP